MSYKAMYRVFRPTDFNELVGQEHISTTLKNALKTDRLAHAYLFWRAARHRKNLQRQNIG